MRNLLLLVMAVVLAGCAGLQLRKSIVEVNRSNAGKLSVGMTKAQVLEVMGPAGKTEPPYVLTEWYDPLFEQHPVNRLTGSYRCKTKSGGVMELMFYMNFYRTGGSINYGNDPRYEKQRREQERRRREPRQWNPGISEAVCLIDGKVVGWGRPGIFGGDQRMRSAQWYRKVTEQIDWKALPKTP